MAGKKPFSNLPDSISEVVDTLRVSYIKKCRETFLNPANFQRILDAESEYFHYSLNMIRSVMDASGERFLSRLKEALDKRLFANDNVLLVQNRLTEVFKDSASDEEEWALMDEDTLNDLLMLNEYARQARKLHENKLRLIMARIENVLPESKASLQNNPIDPKNFLTAFNEACKAVNFEYAETRHLFRIAQQEVLNRFSDAYDRINEIFIEKGILPDLTLSKLAKKLAAVSANNASPGKNNSSGRAQPTNGEMNGPGGVQSGSALSPELGNAWQQVAGDSGGAMWSNEQASIGQGNEDAAHQLLTSLLDNFHRSSVNNLQAGSKPVRIPFQPLIQKEMSKADKAMGFQQLSHHDKRVVNVLNSLFDTVFQDETISNSAKKQVGRIQIPLLKTGLNDNQFFANKAHPARQLVNKLLEAGYDWTEEEADTNPFQKRVVSIVDRVVTSDPSDPNVLQAANSELDTVLKQIEKNCQLITDRLIQAEKASEKVTLANELIDKTIEAAFKGNVIPNSVRDLAQGVWKKNFLLTYLKSGSDNDSWRDLEKSLNYLVACTQVRKAKNPEALFRRHRRVIEKVEGLSKNVQSSPAESAERIKKLEQLFDELKQASESGKIAQFRLRRSLSAAEIEAKEKEEREANVRKAQEQAEADYQPSPRAAAFIEKLKSDTWIEYKKDSPVKRRAKFVCYTGKDKLYVFVNRFGMRDLSLSKKELAEMIDEGNIKSMENSDMFDQALEQTIEHMRQMARKKQLAM